MIDITKEMLKDRNHKVLVNMQGVTSIEMTPANTGEWSWQVIVSLSDKRQYRVNFKNKVEADNFVSNFL